MDLILERLVNHLDAEIHYIRIELQKYFLCYLVVGGSFGADGVRPERLS
jgi:hypothetical protein